MASVLAERALRADPDDFRRAADHIRACHDAGQQVLAVMSDVVSAYRRAQVGPDLDVIVASTDALIGDMRASIAWYPDLADAFSAAHAALSEAQWSSDDLYRRASTLADDPASGAPADLQPLFDQIRAEEDLALRTLTATIQEIAVGDPAPAWDAAAVEDLLTTVVGTVEDRAVRYAAATAVTVLRDQLTDGRVDLVAGLVAGQGRRFSQLSSADQAQVIGLLVDGRTDFASALSLAADGDDRFVGAVLEVLGDDQPAASGQTKPVSLDGLLDVLTTALQRGWTPDEAGLPPALFPAAYVELKALEAEENGSLRVQLDDRSGLVFVPDSVDPFADRDGRRAVEELLAANGARQAVLRQVLGIDGSIGPADRVRLSPGAAAEALIGHAGAAPVWTARLAGELADGSLLRTGARELGLDVVAPRLAVDAEAAVAFYNGLGAEGTAGLLGTYREGMQPTFRALADGLGGAAATEKLAFTGADYVRAEEPAGTGSTAQLLVITDEIPDGFLAEATAEMLRLSEALRASGRWQTMGSSGPYVDRTGGGERFLVRSGDPTADAGLVLLDALADREPVALFQVLAGLEGSGDMAALVRRTPVVPRSGGGPEGASDRLAAALIELTSPTATGDRTLSDTASAWLVGAAGNPGSDDDLAVVPAAAAAVEHILFSQPTAMVLSAPSLAKAGRDRPAFAAGLDEQTISNALEAVFRSGDGDRLVVMREVLVPYLVSEALVVGDGDPAAIGAPGWLGEIDGRIDGAMSRAGIDAAHDLDARNAMIQSLAGTAAETAVGLKVPGAGSTVGGAVTDQSVGQLIDVIDNAGLLPTDNERNAWAERWRGENEEPIDLAYRIYRALRATGRLAVPDPSVLYTPTDGAFRDLVVVDSAHQPVLSADGRPVTVDDWASAAGFGYQAGNAEGERQP